MFKIEMAVEEPDIIELEGGAPPRAPRPLRPRIPRKKTVVEDIGKKVARAARKQAAIKPKSAKSTRKLSQIQRQKVAKARIRQRAATLKAKTTTFRQKAIAAAKGVKRFVSSTVKKTVRAARTTSDKIIATVKAKVGTLKAKAKLMAKRVKDAFKAMRRRQAQAKKLSVAYAPQKRLSD